MPARRRLTQAPITLQLDPITADACHLKDIQIRLVAWALGGAEVLAGEFLEKQPATPAHSGFDRRDRYALLLGDGVVGQLRTFAQHDRFPELKRQLPYGAPHDVSVSDAVADVRTYPRLRNVADEPVSLAPHHGERGIGGNSVEPRAQARIAAELGRVS